MSQFQPDLRRAATSGQRNADVATLAPAAMRRLSNQIGRAYRGTYGATTGLRTLVQVMARQLLVAGSTPQAVARAFEECVVSHPGHNIDRPRNIMANESDSVLLVEVTRECVATVANELGVSF